MKPLLLFLALVAFEAGAELALNASEPCVFGMTAALSTCKAANATAAGVRAAFAEANEYSRLQLHLDLRDDAGIAAAATANVAAMIADGVFGIVASSRFDPTAAFAAGVPIIAPATGEAAFRAVNSTAVLARPSFGDIVETALSLLAFDFHNLESLALVAGTECAGNESAGNLHEDFGELDLEILVEARFDKGAFDAEALAAKVFDAAPLSVLISTSPEQMGAFIEAYERKAQEEQEEEEELPTFVTLHVECILDLLDELEAHNVSSPVYAPMWLPDPESTSSVLAASFRRSMAAFEPEEELNYAALEGYLAGRLVSKLASAAILESRWPLTQSALLDAAFRLGTIKIDDWSIGPLSRSPSWCNQGEMHIRELTLSAVNGITSFAGNEWCLKNCGQHESARSATVFIGQTIGSGPTHPFARAARKGILLGLASRGDASLALMTLDDDYNATIAAENTEELKTRVAAFAGCGGTEVAKAVVRVVNESSAIIGSLTGAQSLRRPFLRNVINLRASYHDEATVLAHFLVTKRNATKFWVLYQDDSYGRDYVFGLQRAIKDLGAKITANVSYTNIYDGIQELHEHSDTPDAFVFGGVVSNAEAVLQHVLVQHPNVLVGLNSAAALGIVAPLLATNNISLGNVFTTSVLPLISGSSQLVSELLDLSATEDDTSNEQSLEGFLIGKFVAEIAQLVLEDGLELNSQNMLDRVFNQKSFSISGLTLGPFSDACLTNGHGDCCNQGSNRVWVAQYNAETQLLEEVPDFEFTLPQCGVDYTDEEGMSTLEIVFAVVFPVLAVVAAIVITFVLLDWRRRKQMAAMRKRTVELENRITELSVVDIGDLMHTPAEHAIALLNDLRQRKEPLTEEEKRQLGIFSALIARNKLYIANFQVRDPPRRNSMDAEIEDYLRDTVVPVTAIKEKTPSDSSQSSLPQRPEPETSASVVVVMSEELRQAAESMKRWAFHPRMLGLDGSMKLSVVCTHLVDSFSLFSKLNLDKTKFAHWMQQIELGYKDNPYHNKEHAVDVLQAMHWMLVRSPELCSKISDLKLLAALVAAACHDFGHGGVNNNFLLRTLDPLAIRYNGVSVLESMHAAESMRLLLLPENNFLESFDRQHFVEFHEEFVQLVLATDMAQHVKLLGEFNALLSTEKGLTLGSAAERLLVLQILIKMADLSNSSRPFEIYRGWTDRIIQEFFAQGRQEKALGLQVSPFMDEEATNLAKMQTSFLGIVVRPLAEAVIKVVPAASVLLDNITSNLKHWADKLAPSPSFKPVK